MPIRRLTDLRPTLQPLVAKFLEGCKTAGLDILIICTYRSGAEQDVLYAQGRTMPGASVGNSCGDVRHFLRAALDTNGAHGPAVTP